MKYLQKCYDKEEYADTQSPERRWQVRIFVTDLRK